MIIKAYEQQKIKKIKKNIFLFYGDNDGYKNHVIKHIFMCKRVNSVFSTT